jgi:hypothetical protein
MKNEVYFRQNKREILEAAEYNRELYANIAAKLYGLLRGKVIDFGNGGVINYDTMRIDKLICVDVTNAKKGLTSQKIDFIYGDFYSFEFPTDLHCVMAQFLLHHLSDDQRLSESLGGVRAALGHEGKFIVVEMLLPRYLELLQGALRPLIYRLLAWMGKPALRFFSLESLSSMLRSTGFGRIETHFVDIGSRVAPAPVLFPRLKIPGRLYPLKCVIVEAW